MIIRSREQKAFTLIEILLVVSLVALISITLYSTFSNGLKLWSRTQRFVVEEDVAIFLERFAEDLRSTFLYSTIEFEGRMFRIAFPARVKIIEKSKKHYPRREYVQQMGKVEYYYDSSKKVVWRRQAGYGQALKEEFSAPRIVLKGVEGLRFNYFLTGTVNDFTKLQMVSEIPATVTVDIDFKDSSGTKARISKTINVPVGEQKVDEK